MDFPVALGHRHKSLFANGHVRPLPPDKKSFPSVWRDLTPTVVAKMFGNDNPASCYTLNINAHVMNSSCVLCRLCFASAVLTFDICRLFCLDMPTVTVSVHPAPLLQRNVRTEDFGGLTPSGACICGRLSHSLHYITLGFRHCRGPEREEER